MSIIFKDFAFLLLINNISVIVISENEKVIRNARHINICYHHIQDLIEKKIIEISHISISEMTADGLTKMLLSNKFKEFVELIGILKIEPSDGKPSDSKPDNGETSNSDKNDGNLVANYYEEAGKEEISFKTEEAE